METSDPNLEFYYQGPEIQLHRTSMQSPIAANDPDPVKWESEKEFFIPGKQAFSDKGQFGIGIVRT